MASITTTSTKIEAMDKKINQILDLLRNKPQSQEIEKWNKLLQK
ncbi:hypothetical protein RDI58_004562 [Solanum bulbocastanum]|uniref:Uncharacterized protein n=1 Tax=Solanum bulbocastanum TaxID=147425 RepID=A0AAN8U4S7_SOLBU